MTLRLSSACSNQLSYRPVKWWSHPYSLFRLSRNCGGKGIRTPDIQLAKLALYQLSYAPDLVTLPLIKQGSISRVGPSLWFGKN